MSRLPQPVVLVYVLLFGLVLGSFVNVCIYRLPLGQSIVRPRSRCTGCGALIRWYQNIPVVSWILLGGKCGSCGARISWRYPFVELLSAVLIVTLWWKFGASVAFAVAGPFALAMVVLFFTDYDHQLLPDAVTKTGIAVGLGLAWFNPFLAGVGWGRIWAAVSGAALGSGLLWGIGAFYSRLRGVEAMGMGDVKMMGMVGAFAGPFGVLMTLFAASVVGAVVGVLLVPLRGRSMQDTLPFGCFLAPAALAALLYGQQVGQAYLRMLIPPP